MKNSIFYIIFLFLCACSTQKQFVENDSICFFDDSIRPDEFILNIKELNKKDLSSSPKIVFENDSLIKKIGFEYNEYYVSKINKKSSIIIWLNYNKDSLYLSSIQFFYKLDNYLEIGVERYFDNKGNIIKTIDYRQKDKYSICYKEAYLLVEKWKPRSYEINHMERSFVVNKTDTIYTWEVHIQHPTDFKAKSYLYTIDAKTGKKIKKVQTFIDTDDDL